MLIFTDRYIMVCTFLQIILKSIQTRKNLEECEHYRIIALLFSWFKETRSRHVCITIHIVLQI